jgi:hypothetical protein
MTPLVRSIHLFGHYTASVAIVGMDAGDVANMFASTAGGPCAPSWLPRRLSLGQPGGATGEKYPVLFGVGRHEGVQLAGFEWLPIFPMRYQEMFIGVPGLRLDDDRTGADGYHYLPRLYLDRFLPTLGGNLLWGLTKRLARLASADDHHDVAFEVTSLVRKRKYCKLTGTPRGPFQVPSNLPELAPLRRLLDELVVSRLFFQQGPFALSDFKWHWQDAKVRPIDNALVTVCREFIPGARPGPYEATRAMEVDVNWSFFLPRLARRQSAS